MILIPTIRHKRLNFVMFLSVIRPLDFSPHIQIPGSATVTLSSLAGGAMLLANLLPPARCPLASPLRCQAPAHHHQPAVSRGLLLRGAGGRGEVGDEGVAPGGLPEELVGHQPRPQNLAATICTVQS